MKQSLKFSFSLFFGVFAIFGFTLAQVNNYPNQQIPQNQPPFYNTGVPPEQSPPTSQPEPQAKPKTTPTGIVPSQNPPPENITDETPTAQLSSSFLYLFYFAVIAVLVVAFFWKRLIELLKKGNKTEPLPAEAEKIPCPTCGGTGKIKKYRTKLAPCGHCKKTGKDICHHCSGTGKSGGGGFGVPLDDIENYPNDCPFCGGKGFPKVPFACCMCKGARQETYEESYEIPCPTCKGTGLVNNY